MASLDRDAILAALFERLKDRLAGSVKDFTRRLTSYHNTPRQPALCLISERHNAVADGGAPPIWTMTAEVMLYLETTEKDDSPETQINALVAQVEAALERQPDESRPAWGGDDNETSLGGLCSSCHVTSVEVAQGVESGQAEALISILIRAPAP